jgi:hypothetical protein
MNSIQAKWFLHHAIGHLQKQGDSYTLRGAVRLLHETIDEVQKSINRNARRKAREDAYRSCGLKKVRGDLGGVYWE